MGYLRLYKIVVNVPYGQLQHCLSYLKPIAYVRNELEWCADVYEILDNVALVTGHEPFGNLSISLDELEEANNKVKMIRFSIKQFRDVKLVCLNILESLILSAWCMQHKREVGCTSLNPTINSEKEDK